MVFSAVLMETEEKHHAIALAPLGTEPTRVYRKSIPGPHLAIPNTVLGHCYHQALVSQIEDPGLERKRSLAEQVSHDVNTCSGYA